MKKGHHTTKFRVELDEPVKGQYLTCWLGNKMFDLMDETSSKTKIPRVTLVRIAIATFLNKVLEKDKMILGANKDLRDVRTVYSSPEKAKEVFDKLECETFKPSENEKLADNLVEKLGEGKEGMDRLDAIIKSLRKKKKTLQDTEEKIKKIQKKAKTPKKAKKETESVDA